MHRLSGLLLLACSHAIPRSLCLHAAHCLSIYFLQKVISRMYMCCTYTSGRNK